MNQKTSVFFGSPLARLARAEGNTLLVSGKLNRTAERYLEILRCHGLALSEPEKACLRHVCGIGFMSPEEISELPGKVSCCEFEMAGLDKAALTGRTGATPSIAAGHCATW